MATKWIIAALVCTLVQVATHAEKVVFEKIPSPVIFRGDATTAYRDPAAIYHDGWFHLFFTLVKIEPDKQVYSYCAISKSRDLQNWSEPRIITPRDQNLNFGSPGNVIRFGDEWVLCLQTYPRPNGEKFGNETSRCWIRRSRDLENWSEPELLRLKGPDVPQEKMGRMIDPFLFEDRDDPGKWWCVSKGPTAWSRDLKTWTPFKGHIPRGRENPCMLLDGQDYVLFLSQNHPDGIAVMRSRDLLTWQEEAVLTFGQREWSWAQGRLTAGFVLDLRQDTDVGKALMFFHGSDFPESSPKGGFDNFASLGIAWSSDLKTWEWPGKTAAGLSATVAPHKGRNVFWVDGKPVPPLMYSGTEHSRSTWERRPRQSIEDFARLGYRIIQTDMWFKYSLQPDDGFDWDGVRKQLDGILKAAPDALFVVRINVSAPNWWLKQNPDETCRVTKPLEPDERARFGGNSAESLASERYAAFAQENLRRFLAGLAQHAESDRIIGFHIGGGVYGEWHYYGIYQEPDASEPMRRAFQAFARGKYGSLDAINAAWQTAFAAESEITVPSYARRYATGNGDFRDPQKDRHVIDYYICQQAVLSSLVNGLCKLTKETWPRPTLVGLFYGYFYGGWTVGEQASQADIETLFRSPYVDYFSGPYASRHMRGSGLPRTLTDSVNLNGKVWLTEHDGGTHLGNISNSAFPDIPQNEAQSIAQMCRNNMYALTDALGFWWYDFGPQNKTGWWAPPRLQQEAGAFLRLMETAMEAPYSKPSDVLVVYDMDSFLYTRPMHDDTLTRRLTEEMTDALLGTGAAFDRIFLMDLERVDLTKYKLVIFGNVFALNASQRAFIKERVVAQGRRVVFFSGAGFTDGATGGDHLISGLAGMNIQRLDQDQPSLAFTLGDTGLTVDAKKLATRFHVQDASAKSIGRYPSGAVGAATRAVNNATVYYFGVPAITSLDAARALIREAGARCYIDGTVKNDYVSVGGGAICIYSVQGGDKTINPMDAPPRTVRMEPFSCRYFNLQTGQGLLSK